MLGKGSSSHGSTLAKVFTASVALAQICDRLTDRVTCTPLNIYFSRADELRLWATKSNASRWKKIEKQNDPSNVTLDLKMHRRCI